VDDLIVYKFNDQKYMLVVNASNIEKDLNWIKSKNNYGVSIKNESSYFFINFNVYIRLGFTIVVTHEKL